MAVLHDAIAAFLQSLFAFSAQNAAGKRWRFQPYGDVPFNVTPLGNPGANSSHAGNLRWTRTSLRQRLDREREGVMATTRNFALSADGFENGLLYDALSLANRPTDMFRLFAQLL